MGLVISVSGVERWKVRNMRETFDPIPDPHAVVLFGAAR
jgi:hypothetical protein